MSGSGGYILAMAGLGVLIALVVWLPLALRDRLLSLPIVCVAIGAALFGGFDLGFAPLPAQHNVLVEHASEFIVLIALMGAGLKIDRVLGWRRWRSTWRLLAITMPVSIALIALLGVFGLGLSLGLALLLAAVLAPTDPVLATDIQVGPPGAECEDEARFALTSEAGLNDGLAFPFVSLGLLYAAGHVVSVGDLAHWFALSVVWKIVAGSAAGLAIGWLFGWLAFRLPAGTNLARTGDGVIAISATLLSYALAESIHGYGFIAVFVAALAIRHAHREHDFQLQMYELVEQVERLAMMLALILLGGALVHGLLAPIGWREAGFAAAVLVLVRPVAAWLGTIGGGLTSHQRGVLAVFGIRGIGSVYYLAYAFAHGLSADADRMWAIVGLIVLLSILIHGLSVTPAMKALDRSEGRGEGRSAGPK